MKATRKLIPALAMLLVAAIVMSSASYAWFTMSRQVTATNMRVNVTAPNNLLIKGANDSVFSEVGTALAGTTLGTADAAATTIYPASSADGVNFFAIDNASTVDASAGNVGKLKGDSIVNKVRVNGDDATGTQTGTYFVDFVFDLKTDNTAAVNVAVEEVKISRNEVAAASTDTDDGLKAVRVAILDGKETTSGEGPVTYNHAAVPKISDTPKANVLYNANGTTPFANLAAAQASYWESGKALSATKAAIAAATRADVSFAKIGVNANPDDATDEIFQVPASGTPTTITVRVWIEGEDQACIVNGAASLDFNVELKLRDATFG